MFRDEFKDREEFLAANKEIGDLRAMEDAGEMPQSESDKKISKITQALNIHQNCLAESKHARNMDCSESHQFLLNRLAAAKKKPMDKGQRLKAAADYFKRAEKNGDLPLVTQARAVINSLEDKAAEGTMRPAKMFEEVRRVKKRLQQYEECILWSRSAKAENEQLRREAQCVANASNELKKVMKKF